MRLVIKVFAAAVILATMMLLGFALWGETFERLLSQEALARWFAQTRPYAWAAAIGLLVGDLVLPIPATGVFAALGSVYGVAVGALVGAAGSTLSAALGYAAARWGGAPLARRLADKEELERFHGFFDRWGGWAIVLSRALPILPEVMAILAGLAGMRPGRFAAAVLIGTIPTAALYAWLGHISRDAPWWGMAAAVLLPVLIWPVFLVVRQRPLAADEHGKHR